MVPKEKFLFPFRWFLTRFPAEFLKRFPQYFKQFPISLQQAAWWMATIFMTVLKHAWVVEFHVYVTSLLFGVFFTNKQLQCIFGALNGHRCSAGELHDDSSTLQSHPNPHAPNHSTHLTPPVAVEAAGGGRHVKIGAVQEIVRLRDGLFFTTNI